MADEGDKPAEEEETPDQRAAIRRQYGIYMLIGLLVILFITSVMILGGGNTDRRDSWTKTPAQHVNDTAVDKTATKTESSKVDSEKEQEMIRKPSGEFSPREDVHMPEGFVPDETYPIKSSGGFPSYLMIWQELLKLDKPDEYDRSDPPFWGKGVVSVFCQIKIKGLIAVNTKDNSFELDLGLRERWVDDRLKYDPARMGTLGVIILGTADEALNGGTGPIWRPDTYFHNAVKFSGIGDSIGQATQITPQGVVFWGRKVSATFMTQYHFEYFPFDKQRLPIIRGDYRYANTQVKVSWDGPHAATIEETVQHPLFDIISFDRQKKIGQYFLGNYDTIIMNIRIQRSVANYFFKLILPVYFIVLLGCLAYRIDVHEAKFVPARVGVIISCVLTQSSFGRQLTDSGPKVSYLTWMDFYVLVAFFFNAFAMLEMGYVLLSNMNKIQMPDGNHESNAIDNFMEIWVPITFTVFTVIMMMVGYWG